MYIIDKWGLRSCFLVARNAVQDNCFHFHSEVWAHRWGTTGLGSHSSVRIRTRRASPYYLFLVNQDERVYSAGCLTFSGWTVDHLLCRRLSSFVREVSNLPSSSIKDRSRLPTRFQVSSFTPNIYHPIIPTINENLSLIKPFKKNFNYEVHRFLIYLFDLVPFCVCRSNICWVSLFDGGGIAHGPWIRVPLPMLTQDSRIGLGSSGRLSKDWLLRRGLRDVRRGRVFRRRTRWAVWGGLPLQPSC